MLWNVRAHAFCFVDQLAAVAAAHGVTNGMVVLCEREITWIGCVFLGISVWNVGTKCNVKGWRNESEVDDALSNCDEMAQCIVNVSPVSRIIAVD